MLTGAAPPLIGQDPLSVGFLDATDFTLHVLGIEPSRRWRSALFQYRHRETPPSQTVADIQLVWRLTSHLWRLTSESETV